MGHTVEVAEDRQGRQAVEDSLRAWERVDSREPPDISVAENNRLALVPGRAHSVVEPDKEKPTDP